MQSSVDRREDHAACALDVVVEAGELVPVPVQDLARICYAEILLVMSESAGVS